MSLLSFLKFRSSIKIKISIIGLIALCSFGVFLCLIKAHANQQRDHILGIIHQGYPRLQLIKKIQIEFNSVIATLENAVTSADLDLLEQAKIIFEEIENDLKDSMLEHVLPSIPADESFQVYKINALELSTTLLQETTNEQYDKLGKLVQTVPEILEITKSQFQEIYLLFFDEFKKDLEKINIDLEHLLTIGFLITIAAGSMIAIITSLIANFVVRRIISVQSSLEKMAKGHGDLTQRLTLDGDDEITALTIELNNFVSKLQSIVKEIMTQGEKVVATNQLMSTAIEKTEKSSQLQNEKTFYVATSIEKMLTKILFIFNLSKTTQEFTKNVQKSAHESQIIVKKAHEDINRLSTQIQQSYQFVIKLTEQAKAINGIVLRIDDISEQTNLLALNASIEAARAGEHGRGFAIVADEVRNLAKKSTDATELIRKNLESFQKNSFDVAASIIEGQNLTIQSTESVEKTYQGLIQIFESLDKVCQDIEDILKASLEQKEASAPIENNIVDVSEISMQTAGDAKKLLEHGQITEHAIKELFQQLQSFKT